MRLRSDRYADAVLALVRRRYAEWDEAPPTAADIGRPRGTGPLRKVPVVAGIEVPVDDEDWPARTFAEKAIHMLIRSPVYPLDDRNDVWGDPRAAAGEVYEWLGDRLVPAESTHWSELTSDDAQSRFAFGALGAGWLRLSSTQERRDDADRAAFVVDARWLDKLEVRPGFERFGAAAWFDDQRRIVRIDGLPNGVTSRPGETTWSHAKYAWRCSVLVGITLSEHIWGIHLDAGNTMVTATREVLPIDHPLRLLLKPFTYRTVSINHRASAVLAAERGLLHRAFSLSFHGLTTGMLTRPTTLTPFPTTLAARGVEGLDQYPFGQDGARLYAVLERYVDRFTTLYFPDRGLERDRALTSWWQAISRVRADRSPLETRRQLVDVVTAFVFAATGLHKHVGSLREYLLDPSFVSGRIRPQSDANDMQGSLLTMLIVAGTGLQQPALLSSFHHLLPDVKSAEAAVALDALMSELRTLATHIDDESTTRVQRYVGFHPGRLECSVSI